MQPPTKYRGWNWIACVVALLVSSCIPRGSATPIVSSTETAGATPPARTSSSPIPPRGTAVPRPSQAPPSREPFTDPCATPDPLGLDQLAVLFAADWSGNSDIYMSDAVGQERVVVVGSSEIEVHPIWSPGGDEIAYAAGVSGTPFTVYTLKATGGAPEPFPGTSLVLGQMVYDWSSGAVVLQTPDQSPDYLWMAWSPNGDRIAFRGLVGEHNHVLVADPSQGNTDMTPAGFDQAGDVSWSSDSRAIAFEEFTGPAVSTIRIIEASGVSIDLTDDFARVTGPRWSPIGSDLVFVGDVPYPFDQPSSPQLYVARYPELTPHPLQTRTPSGKERAWWSPDGTRLAYTEFTLDADGLFASKAIGLAAISGTEPRILISDPGINLWSVNWSPDGTHLSYTQTTGGRTDLYVISVCTGQSRVVAEDVLPWPAPWRPVVGLAGTILQGDG